MKMGLTGSDCHDAGCLTRRGVTAIGAPATHCNDRGTRVVVPVGVEPSTHDRVDGLQDDVVHVDGWRREGPGKVAVAVLVDAGRLRQSMGAIIQRAVLAGVSRRMNASQVGGATQIDKISDLAKPETVREGQSPRHGPARRQLGDEGREVGRGQGEVVELQGTPADNETALLISRVHDPPPARDHSLEGAGHAADPRDGVCGDAAGLHERLDRRVRAVVLHPVEVGRHDCGCGSQDYARETHAWDAEW